ncbi:unnamed protein product, partial [Rotaria magnacalcarata]
MKTLHEESNANIQAFILSYCCPSVLVYSCFSVYVENSSHPYIPSVKKEPGSCFKRKADVPALSLDFFDLNLFHSSSTSFNHCIQMVVVAFVEI